MYYLLDTSDARKGYIGRVLQGFYRIGAAEDRKAKLERQAARQGQPVFLRVVAVSEKLKAGTWFRDGIDDLAPRASLSDGKPMPSPIGTPDSRLTGDDLVETASVKSTYGGQMTVYIRAAKVLTGTDRTVPSLRDRVLFVPSHAWWHERTAGEKYELIETLGRELRRTGL